MGEFFRFWRKIPRFIFSLLFIMELFFLINKNLILFYLTKFNVQTSSIFLSNNFFLLILFIVISIIGAYILDISYLVLSQISSWLVKRIFIIGKLAKILHIYDLMQSTYDQCLFIFKSNSKDILTFYSLKTASCSGAIALQHSPKNNFLEVIDKHYKKVDCYLLEMKNSEIIKCLVMQTNLTQEYRRIETFNENLIELFYFFVDITLLYKILTTICSINPILLFLFWFLILLLVIISAKNKKYELSSYVLFSFLDAFSSSDIGTVDDKDIFT